MKLRRVLLIYNLLLPFALILGLPGYLIKAIKRGGARKNFSQRFGRYGQDLLDRLQHEGGRRIWIHAVSVGEVLVGLKVIQALMEMDSDHVIVLSTTTPTGYRLAKEECPEAVCVIYNPVDLPWVVRGALNRIRPDQLILVEAEVWPNLVYQAQRRGVKVSLVNARLSERSERRFNKFGALTRPIFRMLDCVCVQFGRDIQRWQGLGVEGDRIHETGSIKYDEEEQDKPVDQIVEMQSILNGLGVSSSRPVLLAGSTHAGEEALIGTACLKVRETVPDLVCIVVPRHVERTNEVVKDLEEIGLHPCLRSECDSSTSKGDPISDSDEPQCLIVNTTGELRAWYYLASVVVIGKSFLGKGGQNPVEPIMAGKPVITGPHMENFKAVMNQLLEAKGLVQIGGEDALPDAIDEMLKDDQAREQMAKRGLEVLQGHRGAANRTVKVISE